MRPLSSTARYSFLHLEPTQFHKRLQKTFGLPPRQLQAQGRMLVDDGVETRCWQVIYTEAINNEAVYFHATGPLP